MDTSDKVKDIIGKVTDTINPSGGIPFLWAFFFAGLLVATVWVGHYITIRGQEQIKVEPKPVAISALPQHDSRVADSILKTSDNVGGLTKTVGGLSENVGSLVKDFGDKMGKVEASLALAAQNTESVNQLQKSIRELQEAIRNSNGNKTDPAFAQKLDALAKQLAETKKVDTVVDLAPIRKDLLTVNQNVMILATIFREKMKTTEEIKLSGLGEEFPRK